MVERYTVGRGKPPGWIRGTWEMFQRADGSVGYQLTIGRISWSLKKGDTIERTPTGARVSVSSDGYWRRW